MTSTEIDGYNGQNGYCRNSINKGIDVINKEKMYATFPEATGLPNNMADHHERRTRTGSRDRIRNRKIVTDLAYHVISHVTGVQTEKVKKVNDKYAKTLERTVDDLSEKHHIVLLSAVRKLDVTEEGAQATLDNIANEMFVDGQFNWGRLVSLFAFAGKMAKYLVEKTPKRRRDIVEKISEYTAEYVYEVLSSRIEESGGWDAFVNYFPEPNSLENTVWRGLIYTVVGLGALATMVAVR